MQVQVAQGARIPDALSILVKADQLAHITMVLEIWGRCICCLQLVLVTLQGCFANLRKVPGRYQDSPLDGVDWFRALNHPKRGPVEPGSSAGGQTLLHDFWLASTVCDVLHNRIDFWVNCSEEGLQGD